MTTHALPPPASLAPANGNHPTPTPAPGPSTRALHAGARRGHPHHSLTPPIVQSATYTFADTADLIGFMDERMFVETPTRQEYGRYGNPTVRGVEARLAALEGGKDAILVSSGMAAITTSLLLLLAPGDHVVMSADSYHRTRVFVQRFLHRYHITCTAVPPGDLAQIEAAIRPETRLILAETPTNPFLRCVDLAGLAAIARRRGLRTLIDSTFATPLNLRPLEYGIDLVVHSVTKYLAGHNDLLAGVIIGSGGLTAALREAQSLFGAVVDPGAAFQIGRGLQTLGLRVTRQNENGLAIARFLEQHPKVLRVWYPGLPSHPDHAIARQQMAGFGGVVSFEIAGDGPAAARFIDALRLPYIAASLGGVDSLIEQPAIMSYYDADPEARQALGIDDALVRFAIGIEETADLIADLTQALAAV
ncbi:MAG: aminotransferase class I/II-fold pyridoxal phosphate-dependent enzyme [Caldilineales bacterium]|nr:aminotransferase class I/II-fold pyridoxal phosphate-dependent enzyme [Caldilineales bacterium]